MTGMMPEPLRTILASGKITESDALVVRKLVYPDGAIESVEAEWLFNLNDGCADQCPEWSALFVEALSDIIVWQKAPPGYVMPDDAKWLMSRVDRDGVIASATELELLLNIMEKSRETPPVLVTYVLTQVKTAVLTGAGPLRSGRELVPGVVDAADVEILRRALYAAGGDKAIAITRAEAEILCDINDATAESENDPAWGDLYVKALANHIMFASGHAVPSRAEMLRREDWLNDTSVDVKRFMLRGAMELFERARSGRVRELFRDEEDAPGIDTSNESVTTSEAMWIADRLNRDGKLAAHELALLAFLKRESPAIHPALKPLIDKVA